MRAHDFLKDDKDTWAGGGNESEPDWHQEIGIDTGQGYQRASGNLPGGVNLSVAADEPGSTTFMPQRGVNIAKGPASLYLGDRGSVAGSYNIPINTDSSVSLNAAGQKDQGVQSYGVNYQKGGFNAGVSKGTWAGAEPQFNVGYSAQFEEDIEVDEMAGSVHGGIRKELMSKGYKYLGGGIDKHVFLEPGTGNAFIVFGYRKGYKEFSPDQKMFADWVRYCEQHSDNPHLPKFSGLESFQFRGQTYIQSRMERLHEASDQIGKILHFIVDYAGDTGQNYEDAIDDMLDSEEISDTVSGAIEKLGGADATAGLIDTVREVVQFGMNHGFSIDLHRGNYMQRANGTVVVNDPFVVWLGGSNG